MGKGSGRGIARTACTLGLAMAVALGGMPGTAVPAWAEEAKGTITVTAATGNEGVTYVAYKVFGGTVKGEGDEKTLTGVSWGDGVKDVFKTVAGDAFTGDNPQDAADYLAEQLGKSTSETILGSDSFAAKLAKALAKSQVTPADTFKAGTPSKALDDGYYLVVTQAGSLEGNTAATAPVFALVGTGGLEITEKASVPKLTKEVQEDSTGIYGKYADAQMGQAISYRLTATLPKNLDSYEKYRLKFVDYLSEGLSYNSDAKVLVVPEGKDVEQGVEISDQANLGVNTDVDQTDTDAKDNVYTKQTALTFNISDVHALRYNGSQEVEAGDRIVIEYTAKLNEHAEVGKDGNPNKAKLVYSNDPNGEGTGTTELVDPVVYTYQLRLLKRDANSGSEVKLPGAKFKIKLTEVDGDKDTTKVGQFLQNDGTLGAEENEFTTDENGEITVKGLDAGTYEIVETVAPDGYNKISGEKATLKITSEKNADGSLKVSTQKEGSADVEVQNATGKSTGIITVTIKDSKNIGMPQTGSTGFVVMIAGGASLVAASLAALLKRHSR